MAKKCVMNKIELHYNDLPSTLNLVGDIAIDTEAMGLNIHRDRLCLVQICDENGSVHLVQFKKNSNGVLDYLAPNLRALILDKNRQKIFHYGRFDIAILTHYLNLPVIENVFCTKIASKFARTYTEYHGLKTIVNELCGVEMKKEYGSSNWSAEELTHDQKRYAANDVIYLHKLRDKLLEMLFDLNRVEIVKEYCKFLPQICKADLLGFTAELMFVH